MITITRSIRVLVQVGRIVGLLLVGMLFVLFRPTPTYAGGVVGDGTAGSCTEDAFNAALVGGGTITFNCGGAKTISLTFYKEISTTTLIDGGGLITLSSNNTFLFQVFSGQTLTLQNITLADSGSNVTGAVENFGTTTISNSQLTNNHSTNNGGAILNHGTLTLINTTLANNKATNNGGGLYNNAGNVTIMNSQFLNNVISGTTGAGGAIYVNTGASAIITASLISSNTAAVNGGGIYSLATLTLTNVTLSGNRANSNGGGGIYQDGGTASLAFVSVVSNTAAVFGGGVYHQGLGTMTLQNTLLANNIVGNCDGVVGSAGYNLSSDTNCGFFTQTGDQQNVSLPLGALTNNGGPTLTHLPLTGNPAIDGGLCVDGITTDQRGWNRPFGSNCDVGAVEVGRSVYLPLAIKP